MANTAQARKRVRQAITRRQRNMSQQSSMRTAIKKFLKLIDTQLIDDAKASFKGLVKKIDTMVTKKLIHINKAARLKSRLNKKLLHPSK
ncbi:MAG: 30S ribosomal protein S20 [Legionellales bacterium]|nr:30S ribosomal protein S20 [Legionellales bacterium]OUX67796.1 MAG: 30S ribosomal protein S20 [bacterium TMED178]